MRLTGFKNKTSSEMNNIFSASNQHNMLPPKGPVDNRDSRFSQNSQNRDLGPRKLSNAGMQVMNGDNNSQ